MQSTKRRELFNLFGWPLAICGVLVTLLFLMIVSAHAAHRVVIVGCLRLEKVETPHLYVCVRPLEDARAMLLAIPDDLEFVDEAYLALFLRDADTAGREYWYGRLSEHTVTRNGIIDAFVWSSEYKPR